MKNLQSMMSFYTYIAILAVLYSTLIAYASEDIQLAKAILTLGGVAAVIALCMAPFVCKELKSTNKQGEK